MSEELKTTTRGKKTIGAIMVLFQILMGVFTIFALLVTVMFALYGITEGYNLTTIIDIATFLILTCEMAFGMIQINKIWRSYKAEYQQSGSELKKTEAIIDKTEKIVGIMLQISLGILAVVSTIEIFLFILLGIWEGFNTVAKDIATLAAMVILAIIAIIVHRKITKIPTEEQV